MGIPSSDRSHVAQRRRWSRLSSPSGYDRSLRKVTLVTGGNPHYLNLDLSSLMMHPGTGGLGKAVIIGLLMKHPSKIYVTARNPPKFQHLIEEISLEHPTVKANSILHLLTCDLTDLKTVQAAAHEVILSTNPKLDIIIGAAGIMFTPPSVTNDGYEIQFGINHMSHALLIKLLLPLLLQSPDPRIVLFTSGAFGLHPSVVSSSKAYTQHKRKKSVSRPAGSVTGRANSQICCMQRNSRGNIQV